MSRYLILTISILLFLVTPLMADQEMYPTSRSMAMGGAMTALSDDFSAIYYNPAGMSQDILYYGGATYGWDGGIGLKDLTLSVIDTQMSKLGAGLSWNMKKTGEELDEVISGRIDTFTLALSYPIYPNYNVGVSGKYFIDKRDGKDYDFSGDAGIWLKPTRFFSIGIVGHNVIDSDVEPEGEEVFDFGIALGYPDIIILSGEGTVKDLYLEDFKNPSKLRYGIQFIIKKYIDIMGGYIDERSDKKSAWTAGLRWRGPKIHFEYAMKNDIKPTHSRTHSISVSLVFQRN